MRMMNKFLKLTFMLATTIIMIGCGGANGEDPGEIYMPDMAYSRAYETYGYNNLAEDHNLKSRGVYYTGAPVPGTMARGDTYSFPIVTGDSGYAQAASYKSPMEGMTLTPAQTKEAERLYQVNCAICHGTALDGNGPLWKGGDGPFPAAPRNLKDDYTKKLSDGQIYHVITYGKGQMGSYASQLYPEQRWWIINFIRNKQGSATDTAKTAMKDSVVNASADTTKRTQ
jgi:mono/diheme cytochrome c family protein